MALLASESSPDEDDQTRIARDRVGRLVRDRWRLDGLLGIGGMAAVYAATHRNGKRVAVKILHSEYSHIEEARRRFVDEGYLANRVRHPGVVSILDDDVDEDGAAFLVMDLLEGETLDARIERQGKLESLEVLKIMDELLDVLAAAHSSGVIHRDVKPNNIFLTRDGQVKLLDFGIARMAMPTRPRTTQIGSTVGTPAFMPPEQARGRNEEIDARTDLWAVGATMFMAITGRQVHQAETTNEELLAAMTQAATPLGSIAPKAPKALTELVDRALAYERDARWPDAGTMQQAVRRVMAILTDETVAARFSRDSFASLDEVPTPISTHRPVAMSTAQGISLPKEYLTPSTVPPRTRKRRARGALVSALAVAVGLLAWISWHRRPQPARSAAAPALPVATSAAPLPAVPKAEPEPAQPISTNVDESTDAKPQGRTLPGAKKPVRQLRPPAGKVNAEPAPPAATPAPPTPAAPFDPLDRRR